MEARQKERETQIEGLWLCVCTKATTPILKRIYTRIKEAENRILSVGTKQASLQQFFGIGRQVSRRLMKKGAACYRFIETQGGSVAQ